MTNAVVPYTDVEKIGMVLAKSKLFGMKTPEEAIALCLIAQAEGKHPATAAQEYHVIQGRPALKADAMLARFQAAGGKVDWKLYNDNEVTGVFSHPQGGSVTVAWSMAMAKRLGYDSKDNWKKFPRAMMRARCISEGVRTVYPGIAVGIYTPEEVQDFDDVKVIENAPATGGSGPTTGEVTAKQAYGSAKAMKVKWAEIRDALLACHTHAAMDAVKESYRVDFATLKTIDGQLFDSLVQVGEQRRRAIDSLSDPLPPNMASHPVEDGGLTPEEMEEYERERGAFNSKVAEDGPPDAVRMKGLDY